MAPFPNWGWPPAKIMFGAPTSPRKRHHRGEPNSMARFLYLLIVLLAVVFSGCGEPPKEEPPPPPEEPKGVPVSLAERDRPGKNVPPILAESERWGRKGDRLRRKAAHDKAVYCYHKCEETYPTEFPETWQGLRKPYAAYIRKSRVYSYMGKKKLAQYYLDKVPKKGMPDFISVYRRGSELQLFYVRGEYQEVLDRLPENPERAYERILAAASKYQLGDKKAHADLRKAWAEFKGKANGLYHLAPPDIRELVNSPPGGKGKGKGKPKAKGGK